MVSLTQMSAEPSLSEPVNSDCNQQTSSATMGASPPSSSLVTSAAASPSRSSVNRPKTYKKRKPISSPPSASVSLPSVTAQSPAPPPLPIIEPAALFSIESSTLATEQTKI